VESATKNRQSLDVLRAMVARAFGDARVPGGEAWAEELGHGWFNVAYRLRLRDGARVVLKIAPPAGIEVMTYERDMMRTEVHALALVREHTDVPVPAVHHYDDSRELCDADWFVMDFVEGDNLGIIRDRLTAEQYRPYAEALGATTRALNRISGPHFGPLRGGDPAVTWRQCFTGMVEDVLRDGERRGVDIGRDYDTVRAILAGAGDCLDEVTGAAFVEWDLWDSNVMVRDGAIVSIIDHERAFYGDPLMEAGFAATELPAMGDPAGFVRGYGRGPSTAAERRRRRLYNLHLLLIMVIETVYRGPTDPGQYIWARGMLDRQMAGFGHHR
jgi:aminoglycoside phosphotransferase (APT) family kinase protein